MAINPEQRPLLRVRPGLALRCTGAPLGAQEHRVGSANLHKPEGTVPAWSHGLGTQTEFHSNNTHTVPP